MATLGIPPAKPAKPTTVLTLPATVKLSYAAPVSKAPITGYTVQWAKNSSFTSPQSRVIGVSTSVIITDLDKNSTYYFRVRAQNKYGWGDWSDSVSQHIPTTPGKPATPTTGFSVPATITVSFSAPSTGGSPITNYNVQYSTKSDFSQVTTKTVTKSPLVLNDLIPDIYYVRVRANNLVGNGIWSDSKQERIISGPKIKLEDGKYYPTLIYVKLDGIYKSAIPYVKVDGVWTVAGG